jgi:hypothetical protein
VRPLRSTEYKTWREPSRGWQPESLLTIQNCSTTDDRFATSLNYVGPSLSYREGKTICYLGESSLRSQAWSNASLATQQRRRDQLD